MRGLWSPSYQLLSALLNASIKTRLKNKNKIPFKLAQIVNVFIHVSKTLSKSMFQVRFDTTIQTMLLKPSPPFCHNMGAILRLRTTCLQPIWPHTLHLMATATIYFTYSIHALHSTAEGKKKRSLIKQEKKRFLS